MSKIQQHPSSANPSASLDAGLQSTGQDPRARLKLTCAWCGDLIEDGPGAVSHGMCANCRAAFLATVPGA